MKVLLHTCCGPCASHCLLALREQGHEPTLFFSNANLFPSKEFDRRLEAAQQLAKRTETPLIVDPPDHDAWRGEVAVGFEQEPEGGARCERCFRYSLTRTAAAARRLGFDAFTTSLTVSPYKSSPVLLRVGAEVGGDLFLAENFKKKGGYQRSLRLSKEYGLYRQRYCGCEFSRADAKKQGAIGEATTLSHVLPFAIWLAVLAGLQILEAFGDCPRAFYPWSYAIKSLVCAALVLGLRPWRGAGYAVPTWKGMLAGVGVGVGVAALWILPETTAVCEALRDFYYRWLVMPIGELPSYVNAALLPQPPSGHLSWAYGVSEAGRSLAIAKLLGSGLVIAAVEEFFFRGWFYRRWQSVDFARVDLSRWCAGAFGVMVLIFGFEHDRWLAGMVAGACYGLLAIRTRGVWAPIVAHGLTNLLLGWYVLANEAYGFW